MNQFQSLIKSIACVLGPTSGLDSEEVDVDDLIQLMKHYQSDQDHWTPFALFDPARNYTRNLVDDTNGKSNILVVCWNPGKGSPIHDHANAHCIMKMLKGSLRETLYSNDDGDGSAPRQIQEKIYGDNEVTYISDSIGLHRISNASATEPAVSLHIYTPPHAHNFGFNIFDEKSGKKSHIKNAPLFSERGRLLDSKVSVKMMVPGTENESLLTSRPVMAYS